MDLGALVSKGRGPLLELLPEPDADALAKLIVAFANGIGGTIVVGVDAQGAVNPNAADDLEPALERALNLCEPPFRGVDLPEWRLEDTPAGRIAAIIVKPVTYQLSLEGREVFVRSGTMNVRLSRDQASMDSRERRAQTWEETAVPGATLEDLDDAIVQEYQQNRLLRGPRGETFTRQELLRDAGAVDAHGIPTASGLLLFGRNPQQFFPQVGVVVVRFRGENMRDVIRGSERYSRRVEIGGPAARMVERTWEVLFEELHQQSVLQGLEREERYDYPPEALREAVVNAICHRDYAVTGQRVEIRLFDDHVDIISPGGLPGHITLENILDEHYSRNPRLVRGLYYWGYIEELGQGIDIIYEAMRRDHHPEPTLDDRGRSFCVTLKSAVDRIQLEFGDRLSDRQLRALRHLGEHERITNRSYQQLCPSVSPETLRLDLRDLVEKGILLKVGSKRGTYYVVK